MQRVVFSNTTEKYKAVIVRFNVLTVKNNSIRLIHWITYCCVLFPLCSLMPLFGTSCFLSSFSATQSHGNSYIFYEVANSYEFVRPQSYKFIRFLLNRTYFTSCEIVWICTNDLHLTPPLNLTVTGVLTNRTKSYEWGRTNSYELATS